MRQYVQGIPTFEAREIPAAVNHMDDSAR